MSTPTPTSANEKYAHSGEQGKPSDVVLDLLRRASDLCIGVVKRSSTTAHNAANLRNQIDRYLSELDRKHEQSEPVCACPQHGTWVNADDHAKLLRDLDVALNGDGAAQAPRLVDLVAQVTAVRRTSGRPLLAPPPSEPLFTASMYGTAEAAEKARAALTAATIAAREPFPSTDPVFEYIDTMPSAGFTITEPLPILSVNAPSEQAGIAHSDSCSISYDDARKVLGLYDNERAHAPTEVARLLEALQSAFRGVDTQELEAAVAATKYWQDRAEALEIQLRANPAPEAQAEAVCDDCDGTGDMFGGFACEQCKGTGLVRPQPSFSEKPSASETPPAMYAAFTDRVANALRQNGWSTGGDEDFNADVECAIRCALANENLHLAAIAAQRKGGE